MRAAPSSARLPRPPAPSGPETDRTIGDLVREGVIDSVDLDAGTAVVDFGEDLSPPLVWLMAVGDTTIWIPPTVGQPVVVLSPEGDGEQGMILSGVASSAMAPLFLGVKNAIRFRDGAQITHDPDAGELTVQTPTRVRVVSPDVAIDAQTTTINGDVAVQGKLTASEDVIADGKSLKSHKHLGVTTGSGVSGAPQ